MNSVILIGNLTKNIELKASSSGKSVVNCTIAVSRSYKNEQGAYESDFISIVAFGSTAEFLNNYCKKGSKIAVQGEWRTRTYQDKNNKTVYVNECLINQVSNLTPKEKIEKVEEPKGEDVNPFNYDDRLDDLPF